MTFKKLNFFLLLFFICQTTNSQQLSNLSNNENPIEIFAEEGIEWHKNENKYVAVGNAKAISGSLSLKSERIEAFYTENEDSGMNIKEVKAKKNVIVEDRKMKITGGNYAEYKTLEDYFLIVGKNIILTSEANTLRSKEKIEYWRSKRIDHNIDYVKIYKNYKKVFDTYPIIMEDFWYDQSGLSNFLGRDIDKVNANVYCPHIGIKKDHTPADLQELTENDLRWGKNKLKHVYESWYKEFGYIPQSWL